MATPPLFLIESSNNSFSLCNTLYNLSQWYVTDLYALRARPVTSTDYTVLQTCTE